MAAAHRGAPRSQDVYTQLAIKWTHLGPAFRQVGSVERQSEELLKTREKRR
jgi:hypothetical protein